MFLLAQNITVFLKYKKKISGHIALTNNFFCMFQFTRIRCCLTFKLIFYVKKIIQWICYTKITFIVSNWSSAKRTQKAVLNKE